HLDSFGAGLEMSRMRGNVKDSRITREPQLLFEPGTTRQLEAQSQLSGAEPDLFGERSIFRTALNLYGQRLAGQINLALAIDIGEKVLTDGHIAGAGCSRGMLKLCEPPVGSVIAAVLIGEADTNGDWQPRIRIVNTDVNVMA